MEPATSADRMPDTPATQVSAAIPTLRSCGERVDVVSLSAQYDAAQHLGPHGGVMAELAQWVAATQGRWPAQLPTRTRMLCLGEPGAAVEELAASLQVGVRTLDVGTDARHAFDAGVTAADDEADRGTDLLIVADNGSGPSAAAVVSLSTGAEPVSLLPRGARALDAHAWSRDAVNLRDLRRRASAHRGDPDELLTVLADPRLSACAGILVQAAARRTAVVLDGGNPVAAALLCLDVAPLAGGWWRVADSSPDPAHRRGVEYLDQQPVLGMQSTAGDGLAGLVAVTALRAGVLAAIAKYTGAVQDGAVQDGAVQNDAVQPVTEDVS